MAKGKIYAPRALTLNQDGTHLAFIGPHNFTITVLDSETLNKVLSLDITPVNMPSYQFNSSIDTARLVCFSPKSLNHLLVMTREKRLLKFSASNGQLLSDVGCIHRTECSAMAVSRGGRYLLTAGDQVLKVWDYSMTLDLNFQVCVHKS